jgi:hypothetical protein
MANKQFPIPQNPIGENFVWRDWFQRISNRVFGSMSGQDSNAVFINGGSIDNTPIGANTASTGKFTTLSATTPVAVTSGGTGSSTASGARTNLGLGTIATENVGISTTVTLAKLTPVTGTNGSLTVVNGIITAYTAPT